MQKILSQLLISLFLFPFFAQTMIQQSIRQTNLEIRKKIYVTHGQSFSISFPLPENYSPENDDKHSTLIYNLSRNKRYIIRDLPANISMSQKLIAEDSSSITYSRSGYSTLLYQITLIPDIKGR
ncbi:hypothetical protein A3F06_02965 [candidate division TM6 bacterium RIFCSPHIGHO2_12_FULL_36_22]|nr:MAG: hypothetical protein A3F06_02965 [candidate division TM6 bacterium RIFCSPHIGHO2_12_FULL_36_22]